MTPPDAPRLLFDFSDPAAVGDWAPIDDRVMGGCSLSRLRADPAGHAVFEGWVSLEQGGGFASVRCRPGDRGRAGATVCCLEVRGAPRRYKLSLLSGDGVDGINHQLGFETVGAGSGSGTDAWQTLRLPIAAFRATFRGRELPGAAGLDPARIRQVGLLIAERQAGPFALEIRHIGLA